MKRKPPTALSPGYGRLLADIKARVHAAQIRAGLAANRELLVLYWDIGRLILDRQKAEGWGAKVIDRLSRDLQNEFPGQQGFSPRNLKYMRAFAEAWPETVIVQPPVAPLAGSGKVIMHPPGAQTAPPTSALVQAPLAQSSRTVAAIVHPSGASPIVQAPLAQLPWYHHVTLLDKLDTARERLWYAAKAVQHGWSRNVLALRQGKAVTNFKTTLPPPQSDLAQQITKDPYLFDFLNLRDDANERAVEDALLAHVEKFLLELGVGFALVGRQIHIEVGDQDFYLDLLFYHLQFRCFVVVDLKTRDFTPEAAEKMNFYLSAVDDRFRQPHDQPSIGLILCRAKNRIIAEYALRDVRKPIGVSDYVTRLVDTLPKALQAAVPSVKEIESGLSPSQAAPTPPRKP
jgi:predicted nuclease of restriction endonuclease-like (RecB) superfamily